MSFWEIYMWCSIGIAISVIIPILRENLPKPKSRLAGAEGVMSLVYLKIKAYLILGLFSLTTSLPIIAFAGDTIKDWRFALLAGYAWDSTIQKLTKQPT